MLKFPQYSVLVFSLLLAGCASLAPEYQRPQLELPGNLKPVSAKAQDSQWWQMQDPAIAALLSEAKANNQDLQIAVARIKEVRASSVEAHANRFPSLDLSLSNSRSSASRNAGRVPQGASAVNNDVQLNLSAAYEVDLWGKLANADQAAQARLLAQEANRHIVESSLRANVLQTYLQLLSLDGQLALAQKNLQTREQNLQLQNKRLAAGASQQLEVNLAQAEFAASQGTVAQLQQAQRNTESGLALLLGRSPNAIAQPSIARGMPLAQLIKQVRVPGELKSELLLARPDVIAAEQALIAANADIGQARAQYFPSLRLSTSVGRESRQLSDLFSPASMLWNVASGLTQPLFRAGAISALVEGAQARKEQANARYVQVVQAAFRDVHDALSDLTANDSMLASSQARVKALNESQRLMELRYKSGYSSYQELLNTQRDSLQAQSALLDQQRAQLAALVDLYKALGGSWTT